MGAERAGATAGEGLVIPFAIGLFIGGAVMTLIVGAMAAAAIDGIVADAYLAGQRHRGLDGDEGTELGRVS